MTKRGLIFIAVLLASLGCSSDDPARSPSTTQASSAPRSTARPENDAPASARDLGIAPAELRSRWNVAIEQTGGVPLLGHLEMPEIGVDGDTASVELADDITVEGPLSDGRFEELTVSAVLDTSPETTDRRELSHTFLPRVILAATLPSKPRTDDDEVIEMANELSFTDGDGADEVFAEGLRFELTGTDGSRELLVRTDAEADDG